MRTGCKWHVTLYNRGSIWEVTTVDLNHNHAPLCAEILERHPSLSQIPRDISEMAIFLNDTTPLKVSQIHATLLRLFGAEMRWTVDDIRNIVQRDGCPRSQEAAELVRVLQVHFVRISHLEFFWLNRILLAITLFV